jgi:hypothetical protein
VAKPKTHQVGQAGEHFVAAELHRRGGYAVTFSGNMPDIDILATDAEHTRTVAIQIKTKSAGSWHTSTTRGGARGEDSADERFWVPVDIGEDPAQPPRYYVLPERWVQNHKTASEIANETGIKAGTIGASLTKLAKAGDVVKADRGYALPQ